MNAPFKIEQEVLVNMTSKGQVLIPKALREANGLIPGGPVRVGINDRGETVVLPATPPAETPDQREARIRAGLAAVCGKYSFGGPTDEVMREIRGDWEP